MSGKPEQASFDIDLLQLIQLASWAGENVHAGTFRLLLVTPRTSATICARPLSWNRDRQARNADFHAFYGELNDPDLLRGEEAGQGR